MPATARERKLAAILEPDARQGVTGPPRPDLAAQLRDLVRRANAGDADGLRQLRKFLDDNPDVWQRAGDLALAGTLFAEHTYTRPLAPPDQRKVTRFGVASPLMDIGDAQV